MGSSNLTVGTAVKCISSEDKVYSEFIGLTGVVTKVYGKAEHADYEVVFPTISDIGQSLATCTYAMMKSELEEYQAVNV